MVIGTSSKTILFRLPAVKYSSAPLLKKHQIKNEKEPHPHPRSNPSQFPRSTPPPNSPLSASQSINWLPLWPSRQHRDDPCLRRWRCLPPLEAWMPPGAGRCLLAWTPLMTHKYRGCIVVLSINKSVEPNEEQKVLTSGFAQGFTLNTSKRVFRGIW
jgi:hypothetical protein